MNRENLRRVRMCPRTFDPQGGREAASLRRAGAPDRPADLLALKRNDRVCRRSREASIAITRRPLRYICEVLIRNAGPKPNLSALIVLFPQARKLRTFKIREFSVLRSAISVIAPTHSPF